MVPDLIDDEKIHRGIFLVACLTKTVASSPHDLIAPRLQLHSPFESVKNFFVPSRDWRCALRMRNYSVTKATGARWSFHTTRLPVYQSRQRTIARCSKEYERIDIEISAPLGLYLRSAEGNVGAVVDEVIPGGSAAESQLVQVDDVVSEIVVSDETIDCKRAEFDAILKFLANRDSRIRLTLLRTVVTRVSEDMATEYWEKKRKEKLSGKKILRRTVGVNPQDIRIYNGGPLNEGSFGVVFTGEWKENKVILKTSRSNVLWADDLLDVELELNELVHKVARGTCARFMGCCEIDPRNEGRIYNGELGAGLWLMWLYQGDDTLGSIFGSGEQQTLHKLAVTLGLPIDTPKIFLIKKFLRTVCQHLATLHQNGVVHRDVKPDNILLADDGPLLIDLGGSASCLHRIINYYPGPGPADPLFSAPSENYLIPSSCPQPTDENKDTLWEQYKPDRFDTFSIGIVLLQLVFPELRSHNRLSTFMEEINDAGLNLGAWREIAGQLYPEHASILDADEAAGWRLLTRLICPRIMRISACDILAEDFLSHTNVSA